MSIKTTPFDLLVTVTISDLLAGGYAGHGPMLGPVHRVILDAACYMYYVYIMMIDIHVQCPRVHMFPVLSLSLCADLWFHSLVHPCDQVIMNSNYIYNAVIIITRMSKCGSKFSKGTK